MAISFDPAQKLAILSAGTTTLNVVDLYSRWKDWARSSDNSKYPPAFSVTGGDVIDSGAGTSVPCYAFLQNGWRVRPQESSHTLNVVGGVLLVAGGGDPFVSTLGSFFVGVRYSQPVQAITVSTSGGGGGMTTTQATQLEELWRLKGLDVAAPLEVAADAMTAGTIALGITEDAGVVTVQRA